MKPDLLKAVTPLSQTRIPNRETPLSRRYLNILQHWLPTAFQYYQRWPDRPECGHFFGGCHWYGMETANPMLVLAAVSTSPEYDARITGHSRDDLRLIAIRALRYLCFTHDTGPAACVRPRQGLGRKENCGTKWGERGRGFFRESQCGVTLARIVGTALLLRPGLDPDTRRRVAVLCLDYLDRFADRLPRSGVYLDTQTEENGWTALGLASASLFLSRHPEFARWETSARRWMFCVSTVPDDALNRLPIEPGLEARQLLGDLRTTPPRTRWKKRALWVSDPGHLPVITMLPDFTAENHGFIHPSYMACAVIFSGLIAMLYGLFGRRPPEPLAWHRQEVYDELKRLSDNTGFPHPVQGMDWPYLYSVLGGAGIHGCARLLLNDPTAAVYEETALVLAERFLHTQNGRWVAPAEVDADCHDVQDPLIMRELTIGHFTDLYLLHRLYDKMAPQPAIRSKAAARAWRGVKIYPHAGFIFHKHDHGQTSFSWRNRVMALPLNTDGLLTLAPHPASLLGQVVVREYPFSTRNVALRLTKSDNGFAALYIREVCQQSVRQQVLLASLPNGVLVGWETIQALKNCTVTDFRQGYLEIMNEPLSTGNQGPQGVRRLFYPDGEKTFYGFARPTPAQDTWLAVPGSDWLNLDDRIGIRLAGNGCAQYHNRHYFKPFRALTDELFLNWIKPNGCYRAGMLIGRLAFGIYPDQPHRQTASAGFYLAREARLGAGILADDYLVAGNLRARARQARLTFARRSWIPVFAGALNLMRRQICYQVRLQAHEARWYAPMLFLETRADALRVEAGEGGPIVVINPGRKRVSFQAGHPENWRRWSLAPGGEMRVPLKS